MEIEVFGAERNAIDILLPDQLPVLKKRDGQLQLFIVDTGSTDRTRDIAREFNARIIEHPWNHHFAEARNAGLKHNITDWILVLDADEELSVKARAKIPSLLASPDNVGGFLLSQRHYLKQRFLHANGRLSREHDGDHPRAASALSYLDNDICRLFRRAPRIQYRGRIHEVTDYDIKAAMLRLPSSDCVIHHFGKLLDDRADLDKHARYRDLLRIAVEESPRNSNMWCQLAVTESIYFNNQEEALRCYLRAKEIRPDHPDVLIEMARIYVDRKEFQRCIDVAACLPDNGDQGSLKYTLLGDASHDLGKLEEARSFYRRALKLSKGSATSPATGQHSILVSKLGYVEVRLGLFRSDMAKVKRAMKEHPRHMEFRDRWVKALLAANKRHEAAEAAERMCDWVVSEKIVARAATLWMMLGEVSRAGNVLQAGLKFFPDSPVLKRLAAENCNLVRQQDSDGRIRRERGKAAIAGRLSSWCNDIY